MFLSDLAKPDATQQKRRHIAGGAVPPFVHHGVVTAKAGVKTFAGLPDDWHHHKVTKVYGPGRLVQLRRPTKFSRHEFQDRR